MTFPSRDEHTVLAPSKNGFYFVQAASVDAKAVTTFLLEQDVRPAPSLADVTALLGRNDAVLFCAVHDGQIKGLAASVNDGQCSHLVHVVLEPGRETDVAPRLVELIEHRAREAGAIILSAQTERDVTAFEVLRACGFTIDCEEGDAADGRVVSVVHFVKTL